MLPVLGQHDKFDILHSMRTLRNHGAQSTEYWHGLLPLSSRTTAIMDRDTIAWWNCLITVCMPWGLELDRVTFQPQGILLYNSVCTEQTRIPD